MSSSARFSARPNPEIRRLDSLIAEGRIAEAEGVARTLLCHERSHVQGAAGLARCAFARNDLAESLRWAERSTRFAPDDIALKAFYAALLIAAGQFAEVPPLLEGVAERAATPTAAIALGQALGRLGAIDRLVPLTVRQLRRFPVSVAPLLGDLADHIVLSGAALGWAAADPGLRIVGALRPAHGLLRVIAGPETLLSIDLSTCGRLDETTGLVRFAIPLGDQAEGMRLSLSLDGTELLGAPLCPLRHAAVEGSAILDGSRVSGWAWSPGDPPRQVEVRVTDVAGRSVTVATDRPVDGVQAFGVEDGDYGFSLDLDREGPGAGLEPGLLSVTAGPGDTPLAGSPLPWAGPGRVARLPVPVGPLPVRPPSIGFLGSPRPAAAVDVVIPVYRGREETLACLHAVLATVDGEIIVFDDSSPEPDLVRDLEALAAEGRITLLRNGRNLGFPATVNRGLRLHPDRDVVLLNADTLVCGDWLARLRAAAYAAHDVGTVTPLSNDATILSYPSGKDRPPSPSLAETAALDRLARAVNAGVRADLPTAVGFCVYIRRDCLEGTGLFEEHLFGRGYGEENDFCLRARRLGWRHLAAADVFVAHVGGRSFGRQKTILAARNGRLLEGLHPGYDALVGDFIAADSLMAARRRLDLARWAAELETRPAEDARPTIALITLSGRGGVARFVTEHTEALRADGWRVLRIAPEVEEEEPDDEDDDPEERKGKTSEERKRRARERRAEPPPERRCRIEVAGRPDLRDLVFRARAEFAELAEALRRAGVAAVEIHHMLGHDPILLDLPARLGVPYDLVVHDYGLICPRVNLVDGNNRYCGEPDLAVCERCTADPADRFDPDLTVTALRRRTQALVARARRVTVPTRDVAIRLSRYVAPRTIEVRPWEDVAPPALPAIRPPRTAEGRWRVCSIGAVGIQKGYDLLLACARDAAARDLPLEFVVVGFSEEDPPLFETGRAFVTGRFTEEEAVDLVRRQEAHLAFLPSISPETWCYALSVAWRAGLEVAAFEMGALAERIRAHRGHLLPPSLDAAAINTALLGILDASPSHSVAIERFDPFRSTTAPRGPAKGPDILDRPTFSSHGVSSMIGSAAPAEATQVSPIKATAQSLPLAPGFYSLIVTSGGGATPPGELPLPSVQLAEAPGAIAGTSVEMVGTLPGNWLTKPGDTVIIKVTGGNANVLLTSYKHTDRPNATLSLQVSRIDDTPVVGSGPVAPVPVQPVAPQAVAAPQPAAYQPAAYQPVAAPVAAPAPRTEILAHVQRQGDMRFADSNWAGCVGQKLWIEAFSITPV